MVDDFTGAIVFGLIGGAMKYPAILYMVLPRQVVLRDLVRPSLGYNCCDCYESSLVIICLAKR